MKPASVVVTAVGVALVVGIVWVLDPGARWVLEHVDGVVIGGPTGLAGEKPAVAVDAVRGRVLAVATGPAALVAVFYTARNAHTARRTFQPGERGHATDRYGKAVEQLGRRPGPGPPGRPVRPGTARPGQPRPRAPADGRGRDLRVPAHAVHPAAGRGPIRSPALPGAAGRWWQFRTPDADDRHWPGLRLDLTGATLMDFNLPHCRVSEARFGGPSRPWRSPGPAVCACWKGRPQSALHASRR
ncbi:hypothetical protein ACGFJC_09745 [Nonomuraea fuscirosea]|uniref:hypothetical protein n=1 Tax=Nonomuraea fuscirosea TaxID=1291556 RepID=UPI003710943D